jgi:hypothetical protein
MKLLLATDGSPFLLAALQTAVSRACDGSCLRRQGWLNAGGKDTHISHVFWELGDPSLVFGFRGFKLGCRWCPTRRQGV